MGIEATRRAALGRTKKQAPPILSHEFIIQNHGDLISCLIMLVMVGFMFQVRSGVACAGMKCESSGERADLQDVHRPAIQRDVGVPGGRR